MRPWWRKDGIRLIIFFLGLKIRCGLITFWKGCNIRDVVADSNFRVLDYFLKCLWSGVGTKNIFRLGTSRYIHTNQQTNKQSPNDCLKHSPNCWILTLHSNSKRIPKCPPNTNPSPRTLNTALLSLLKYPHPRLPMPYTHRYAKTFLLIPIRISSKKHLVNELGVIQYLHLIQTRVFTNQRRHRLWERGSCCLRRFCFG